MTKGPFKTPLLERFLVVQREQEQGQVHNNLRSYGTYGMSDERALNVNQLCTTIYMFQVSGLLSNNSNYRAGLGVHSEFL